MLKAFLYSSPLSLLFPLLACFKRDRHPQSFVLVLKVFVLGASLTEILSTGLWLLRSNNLFLLHFYTFWELEVISLFYLLVLPRSAGFIVPLMLLYPLITFGDSALIHDLQHFNVMAKSVECMLIIVYALCYLYTRLLDIRNNKLSEDPLFIMNAAFLFYFSTTFFLFLCSNNIMQGALKTHIVWALHTIVLWIFYTTTGLVLWKSGRK